MTREAKVYPQQPYPQQLVAPMTAKARFDKWPKRGRPRNAEIDFGFVAWSGVTTSESTSCTSPGGSRSELPFSGRRMTRDGFPTFAFSIVDVGGSSYEYTVSRRGQGVTVNGSTIDVSSPSGGWYWRHRRFHRPMLFRSTGEPIAKAVYRFRGPIVRVLAQVSRAELDIIAVTWVADLPRLCAPAALVPLIPF